MTTREEAIAFCRTLPFVYEDYPFHDDNWTLMRHQENRKSFAILYEHEGHIWVNVKAEPVAADLWKRTYSAVVPAYHMNKDHWISIILDGSMADEDVARLIRDSFDLTARRRKWKENADV